MQNRHYRTYSDQDIISYSKEVHSIAALLKCLGLKPVGGNYSTIKRKLQKLDVDCSHWTGQAWCKGKQLKDWADYNRVTSIKPHLIEERGYACEHCKGSEWFGSPIPLEVHHIDGHKGNNAKENLQLLCPNCHALTKNYRGRNAEKDPS